ncbi:hypothetical protein [Streptomyces mirabilis]|uniref:hypothetical protein n=1 Tax=Streptomyces mirabilis TaxID=68239 RepID=UPI0036A00C30
MTEYNSGDRVEIAATGDLGGALGTVDRDHGGENVFVFIDGEPNRYPHDAKPIPRDLLTLIEADEDEEEGDAQLSDLIAADGVTLTSELIATGTNNEGWQHHEYRVTLAYDGRTYTQTVQYGIAVTEAPELVETVHMLVSQSMTAYAADDYAEWASDFSSDPAEWMPEKTYTDNVKMAEDLRTLLGAERFERYAMADCDA